MKKKYVIQTRHQTFEIDVSKPASFEDAITATGFGTFNLLLVCIVIPCSFAQVVEQVAVSYIVPIAQCDLDLSLEDKGFLNSMGYIGMITSGFLWGYICDNYGRRKVMLYGYLFNSLFLMLAAFSQNFTMLLVTKFFSGMMLTGPFSAIATYLSEFHASSNRAKMQIVRGVAIAIAIICLPLIGWEILPANIKIEIAGKIRLQAWNVFLIICALPAFISATIFMVMPESPKFLMAQGRNEEALKVFQLVHRINCGKMNTFPISLLVEENPVEEGAQKEQTFFQKLKSGFQSVKPLFSSPHALRLLHACITFLSLVAGVYGLKIWYPQLLQGMNDYEKNYGSHNITICGVIELLTLKRSSGMEECTVNLDNSSVYINSAILGAIHLSVYILAGIVVNKLGKKTLIVVFSSIAAVSPMIIYVFSNTVTMRVFFPLTLAFGEVCANLLMTVIMELFPTAFRLTALNIALTAVRFGTAVGNVIFPYLLRSGCLPLLLFIALCIAVAVILTSVLPSTENQALK